MKTRVGSIVLLATTLVLGPALQSSEAGGSRLSHRDVVLYELNEQAMFVDPDKPDDPDPKKLHRIATSGLQGKAKRGTPLCSEALMVHAEQVFKERKRTVKDPSQCTVVAFGNSDLDLATLQGKIDGQIYVVINSELTNLVDAPELVVMSGEFTGAIAVTDLVIITITDGTLTGGVVPPTFCPAGCKFTGKFRQPFKVRHWAVYKKDNGDLVPVLPDERALGDPTVRLEITFVGD